MKSPFTGGQVTKKTKQVTLSFRKEEFTVDRTYYQCVDTGKTFSDEQTDEAVMSSLYSQYRKKHGIPSPSELKQIRERYHLSAHCMSKIAGLGINQYGLYENGEMPSLLVGHKLASLMDKQGLLSSLDKNKNRLGGDYQKVRVMIEQVSEPVSYLLEKTYYADFSRNDVMMVSRILDLKRKPRWTSACI